MADRELDISMFGPIDLDPDLEAAIDAASDQGQVTWLARDGKRVAKIAPVNEPPVEAIVSFLALDREERREAVRARWAQPPPEPGLRRHTSMAAHDGWLPHSHEVRPDHLGVPRTRG
jgi:hypothetical protein